MYPTPPYPGYTWSLTQHMGRVSEQVLYHILLAAVRHAHLDDPADAINEYIIDNDILPENYRADRGRPDVWRDYQQMLSELGLIYSTEVTNSITATPLGLAFLDRTIDYPQFMAMQATRYQYPNGHKLQISPAQREALQGTRWEDVPNLAVLQYNSGVMIRPGALIWRVLRILQQNGEEPRLSVAEIEGYLMRCTTNDNAAAAAGAIIRSRHGDGELPREDDRNHRNAQDWIKFLLKTPLFEGATKRNAFVQIAQYGLEHTEEMDSICTSLERPGSFWLPDDLSHDDRISWYAHFGSVDLSIPFVPSIEGHVGNDVEEPTDTSIDDHLGIGAEIAQIQLREFEGTPNRPDTHQADGIVRAEYDAARSRDATRLHNSMVNLIAQVCRENGASVYADPQSVDLLVVYRGEEFIIEVKSVTPSNFMQRLRYAIGQVQHYDYRRSLESDAPCRKVIALAARVPDDAWVIEFLNDHLGIDLLSLDGATLRVYSDSPTSVALFST